MNGSIFIKKPLSFFEIMVLIFYFKSIFQENENRLISLSLKAKQQKRIQLSYIFLKFNMNQFTSQVLLFFHFFGL